MIDIWDAGEKTIRAVEGNVVYVPRNLQHHIEDVKASTLFLLCFSDALGLGFPEWGHIQDRLGKKLRLWRPCLWNLPYYRYGVACLRNRREMNWEAGPC